MDEKIGAIGFLPWAASWYQARDRSPAQAWRSGAPERHDDAYLELILELRLRGVAPGE